MGNSKRTTVSINGEKRLMLERLAIDASYKAERPISWTDIVHHAIDNYAKESAKDLMHSTADQKKKI